MENELLSLITEEIKNQFQSGTEILLVIISVSYISSIFTEASIDKNNTLREIITFAIICILAVPMIENVKSVIVSSTETIEEVRTVMLSSVPVLCASEITQTAAGAAVFITLTQSAAVLLSEIFLPLSLLYSVLGLCGSISNRFSIDGVKGMVKSAFNWGLGLMMIVFSCTATLTGALTGAKTSMAARTVKYTGAMVPVVGRYLAESTDMVFAGSSMIKSTAGIAAVIAIITAAAIPCVKIGMKVIIYRIAGILVKPVADVRISNAISNIGDAYMMVTGVTALMSIMSILNISILVTIARGGV